MTKSAHFFKSIAVFLISLLLEFVAVIPTGIIYIVKTMADPSNTESAISICFSLSTNTEYLQMVNMVYGIIAFIFFLIWYQNIFVRPFKGRQRKIPSDYTFHTFMSFLCMALGMQLVTNLIVNLTAKIHPQWLTSYNSLMQTSGYDNLSLLLIVYTVIIAPVVEEMIYRGLIFRYARHAMPFWLANIWQAFLFGLAHMNVIQGVYAFLFGLLLGFICHRGRGIRYSIPVHICFNLISIYASGLLNMLVEYRYNICILIGFLLLCFGLWLFYTDFITETVPVREPENYYDDIDEEDD